MIVINGDFLCRNLTGVERFAYEVTLRLDCLVEPGQLQLYVPKNGRNIPELKNIQCVVSDAECSFFPAWEHGPFRRYVRRKRATPLDFANVTPWGTKGIVFIHDIYAKLYPEDFSGRRDRLVRRYMCLMYRYATRHAKLLLTVSQFSRNQIAATYRIPAEQIAERRTEFEKLVREADKGYLGFVCGNDTGGCFSETGLSFDIRRFVPRTAVKKRIKRSKISF